MHIGKYVRSSSTTGHQVAVHQFPSRTPDGSTNTHSNFRKISTKHFICVTSDDNIADSIDFLLLTCTIILISIQIQGYLGRYYRILKLNAAYSCIIPVFPWILYFPNFSTHRIFSNDEQLSYLLQLLDNNPTSHFSASFIMRSNSFRRLRFPASAFSVVTLGWRLAVHNKATKHLLSTLGRLMCTVAFQVHIAVKMLTYYFARTSLLTNKLKLN